MAEAKQANEAHERDIQELQTELEEVDARRQEYEDLVAGESQSQGRDVQLEDAQVLIIIEFEFLYPNREWCTKNWPGVRVKTGYIDFGRRNRHLDSA